MLLPRGTGLLREDQWGLEDTTITRKSYILKPDRLGVAVWECILYADMMLYRECKGQGVCARSRIALESFSRIY